MLLLGPLILQFIKPSLQGVLLPKPTTTPVTYKEALNFELRDRHTHIFFPFNVMDILLSIFCGQFKRAPALRNSLCRNLVHPMGGREGEVKVPQIWK